MKQTIDILRKTDIISKKNVSDLKRYIVKKYPDCTHAKQTEVFADSVHRILNKNLMPFHQSERDNIKKRVITGAVNEGEFSINAYDVFRECIIENNGEDEYVRNFENWLCDQKGVDVDRQKIGIFLGTVFNEPGDSIDQAIENAVNVISSKNEAVYLNVPDKSLKGAEPGNDIKTDVSVKTGSDIICTEEKERVKEEIQQENISGDDTKDACKFTYIIFIEAIKKFVHLKSAAAKEWFAKAFCMLVTDKNTRKFAAICVCTAVVLAFAGAAGAGIIHRNSHETVYTDYEVIPNGDMGIVDGLSNEYKYSAVDMKKLKNWLNEKDSILADDEYLKPIIDASKEFDVNPLLLIAIAGQEQAFVPRNIKGAERIANNPFNVYGSWQDYNTSIKDSARLAAMTVVDASNGRPVNSDELEWINKKYARDPNWWVGVTKIFHQIEKDVID